MRVGEMLFKSQVTFIIEKAIQNIGGVAICTFDGNTVERGVIVCNERVKFQA